MKNPIAERPWLLVIALFLVIIAVWITVYNLAGDVATFTLTPEQERAILEAQAEGTPSEVEQ